MAQDNPVTIRRMNRDELPRISEIDRSEHVTLAYEVVDGRLTEVVVDWKIESWPHGLPAEVSFCRSHLDQGGLMLGAFQDGLLVGTVVVRPRFKEDMALLAFLYINREHRRQGVAGILMEEAVKIAREAGQAGCTSRRYPRLRRLVSTCPGDAGWPRRRTPTSSPSSPRTYTLFWISEAALYGAGVAAVIRPFTAPCVRLQNLVGRSAVDRKPHVARFSAKPGDFFGRTHVPYLTPDRIASDTNKNFVRESVFVAAVNKTKPMTFDRFLNPDVLDRNSTALIG